MLEILKFHVVERKNTMDVGLHSWLTSLLSKGVKDKYIPVILERTDLWTKVFTPKHVDPTNNYEVLEIVGDGVAGYFFPIYFLQRFPQLNNPKGVKVVARLKIVHASKKSFASIANSLGFWQYIRKGYTVINQGTKENLLEDTFEAFLGALSTAVDDKFKIFGLGAAVVCSFLKHIFDGIDISLDNVVLFDAKTRLKELMDVKKNEFGGNITYVEDGNFTKIILGNRVIGQASGAIKKDREKEAAEAALALLKREGHFRDRPDDVLIQPALGPSGADLTVASSAMGGTTVFLGDEVQGSGGTAAQALARAPTGKKPSAVDLVGGDYKSRLKEIMDSRGELDSLSYAHENITVTLLYKGVPVATAANLVKKVREQMAAKKYYLQITA
ncbi:putative RNAseIII [Largemouth bass virus]|uniref:RNAseIII n=1 Tax=Largemouth bass virus TaxID=176656 RepID=A0A9E7THZ4_9VIRU|nr:putative RNAseIII [Largemouth bass virus]WAK75084.1 putative RNAse III [Mandarin fish ranavirus]WEI29048.1 putative RNAseIII [Largemouth bass virus]WHA35511.1 putative RNAseIII [Micropterus salmoides ranavirus]WHA35616.1 putative RNAseIII [Siniperca chuatsi ranavirus]